MNALVVPTNSGTRLAHFLEAWAPWPWDRLIIVVDGPRIDLTIPKGLEDEAAERLVAFSWAEIDRLLPDPSIISRCDSAIRSFGFWWAWRLGAEIVFTLDDDCYPSEDDFVATHRANLYATPRWVSSVPELRVRGLPYRHLGMLADVQLSMGLWRGTPDFDAPTALAGQPAAGQDAITGAITRVMPSQQFFPMSGMNLAFRREITPLMLFAPMGAGQRFARFDDIWCGLLLQRICRHLDYAITVGRPLVDHRRASDPFRNLVKEAPGIEANERLWEAIAALTFTARTPEACMAEAGRAFADSGQDYLVGWGRAIGGWCELFETARTAPPEAARTAT